jgi:ABC-type glycerol-3-phosphate transport system substrate-binding protein
LAEKKTDEKKVSRRKFIVAGAGVVVVAAAAGAGYYLTQPSPAQPGMTTSTTVATSMTETTAAPTVASTQAVEEIKIFTQKNPLVNSLLKVASEKSVSEIGVKVDADQLDFTQMAPQLTAMSAGGDIPYDLISMAHDQLGPYVSYLRGMDDLVQKYNFDLSVYFPFLVNQLYKRDKATGRFGEGSLIGLAYESAPWGLQYNTQMFKAAGLVDSKGNPTPPETWDKFVEYMKELTKPPKQYGLTASLLPWWNPAWMQVSYVATKGGAVLDKDFRPLINDKLNVESVEFWSDAVNVEKYMEPTALSTDDAGLMGMYGSGRAASLFYWVSDSLAAANDPASSQAVGLSSVARQPGDGQYRGKAPGGGWAYEMPTTEKHPDASFKYAGWITTHEVDASLESGAICFTRKASYDDPRLSTQHPVISTHPEIGQEVSAMLAVNYAEPSFEIAEGSQIWQIWLKYFQDTVAGKRKAQAAMDACYTEWDAILKKYYS